MDYTRIAGRNNIGGVYVCSSFADAFRTEATITFDWTKLDKAEHTRLINSLTQGFSLSYKGITRDLLEMLASLDASPKFLPVGYLGKKAMNVLVPYTKLEQYKTDLIAAGHMLDVDLSTAVRTQEFAGWGSRYRWLCVSGWEVKSHNPEPISPTRWGRRRDGSQLKPATSKLANLVRSWQEELLFERQEMIEFIKSKPAIVVNLLA